MSRSSIALAACALLIGCVVSFDGYRAQGSAGGSSAVGGAGGSTSSAGSAGRAGTLNGGNAGDGNAGEASANGGDPAAGGSSAGGDGNAGTPNGGGADSSGGTDGSAGAAGSAGPNGCPTALPGPDLVEILHSAGLYCIDSTEVRNSDYADFLDDFPDTAQQGSECSWNAAFDPEADTECESVPYDPVDEPNHPITCIDWCDAKKYCEWAGKTLCGAITGGSIPPLDFADAMQDAWFSACSAGGTKQFPYGNSYQMDTCVGVDYEATSPIQTGPLTGCEGGYEGLWDMSGNVSEWEDSCEDAVGASDECLHRGGSLLDADSISGTGQSLRCNSSDQGDTTPSPALAERSTRHRHIGFRCCYVP